MKKQTIAVFSVGCITAALLGYWVGHSRAQYRWPSDGSPHTDGLTLGKVLLGRGINPEAITRFEFVGDENSSTRGLVAVDTNVAWIWGTMIATAEPYTFWLPSGYRRVEVFTQASQEPAAVLFVNETDATHLEGDSRRFMCHGLHSAAMNLLREAKQQKNP